MAAVVCGLWAGAAFAWDWRSEAQDEDGEGARIDISVSEEHPDWLDSVVSPCVMRWPGGGLGVGLGLLSGDRPAEGRLRRPVASYGAL